MPIDAEAYMAGALPALSFGGSLAVPPGTSHHTNPYTPTHYTPGSPSAYSGMQQDAMGGGFFMNPLMLGRMAAFGSSASPSPSAAPAPTRPPMSRGVSHGSPRAPDSPHHQRRALSVVTSHAGERSHAGSPLRYAGWSGGSGRGMEPGSPGEGSVRQRMARSGDTSFGGERRRAKGDWESNAGAPKSITREASYHRRQEPMSLPLSEVQREEHEGRRHHSQPRMRPERLLGEGISPSSARFRPSPLSGVSIPEEGARKTARFATRPTLSRRHTEEYEPPSLVSRGSVDRVEVSPPSRYLRPALSRRGTDQTPPLFRPPLTNEAPLTSQRPPLSRRHTEQVETPPAPPPRPTPRVRVESTPHPFDMQSMADALEHRPRKYKSPAFDEEYDRYVAHPAVDSPTTVHHQPEVSITLGGGGQHKEYLPLGYARPTREIEWNRDGPAMKTHGIAWKRDADVLPAGPQGPRWIQARPPSAQVGGAWGSSAGE